MSVHGHVYLTVLRYIGSQGFIVKVAEGGHKPSKEEVCDTNEALLAYLRKFNLERWTPEQVLEQLMVPPRENSNFTKIRVLAREAAKGAATGNG
jgi:hypothetical protein